MGPVVFGEGAVAALWAAALITVALWFVCLGLRFAWMRTFGAAFYWIGGVLKLDVSFVHWHPGGYFIRASDAIANALEHAAASCENTAGRLFHGAAVTQAWVAHEVAQLGRDVYGWANWLQRSHLPRWVKALIYALIPPLVLPAVVKALGKLNVHSIVRRMKIIETTITTRVVHVVKTVGAVAIPGAVALPGLRKEVSGLTRRWWRLQRRLAKYEALFTTAGSAALLLRALRLRQFRWIKCPKVARMGNFMCGLDHWILDLLLLGSVEAFIVSDLCRFSELLIQEAESLRPALMKLVDVEDALIDCGGTSKPVPFRLPAATLPPLQGASPLAA